ncbi:deoxyribodipyrimidine photo-lyase, partial [Tenuifilum sp.]|uniref:deoxyribodipyrimidine photo-lyase n=1 Tax=Tenuifilum sp. TaxID=2760880 RepID=UPI002B579C4F|nr:deoxyribodipyrimidine photo-lyase [Tenuifilum sp.]HPP91090.1 deoxyribodipyrimidine photo-lyase [Tenuifilum sp.]
MFGRDGFNKNRVRELKVGEVKGKGPIIYWMSRDQRVADNWALTYAKLKANEHKVSLRVVFTLAPAFPAANLRHYDFMLKGLAEVEKSLAHEGIPFNLLRG